MFKLKISIKDEVENLHMLLLNGSFETIYDGYSNEINVTVQKGIYKLILKVKNISNEIDQVDSYQLYYYLILDNNKDIIIDLNKYDYFKDNTL